MIIFYLSQDPETAKTSIKRRILKVAVTIMFLIMAIGVIVIWSLHDGGKEDKQAKFFFFHADDLYLKADTQLDKTSVEGTMGGPLFVVPESRDREKDECDSEAKWCFTWKEKTVLMIDYVDKVDMKCMSVSWQNITSVFPTDCYQLKIGDWYGMGGDDMWPMNNNHIVEQYYLPGYDTQRGNVYEFYLLSSLGTSIYITSEDPFLLRFNDTNDSRLCISPAAVGPKMFTSLQYSICQSNTIQETHAATTLMSHIKSNAKINLTSYEMFSWKVGNSEEFFNLSKLTSFMDKLTRVGYVCGTVEIGFRWETHMGDFEFDSNILNSLKILKSYNCKFILAVSPVVSYLSSMFDIGMRSNMFILDMYQSSVRLYHYDDVQGALLDTSKESVRTFLTDKLRRLSKIMDITSFKLKKIPVSLHTSNADGGKFSVSGLYRGWIDVFQDVGKMPILQNIYRAQDKPTVIEVDNTINIKSDNSTCLDNPLPAVFTLGLDGYPYLQSTLSSNDLTSELLIRWMQYSAFFTGITLPSDALYLNLEADSFINKVGKFRDDFVSQMLRSLQPDISSSQPILLPLWWYYSDDPNVYSVNDQFLFNETILIAPIYCAGQTTRDIYLPAIDGIWSYQGTEKDYKGKKWLRDFNIGLDEIPYFKAKMLY